MVKLLQKAGGIRITARRAPKPLTEIGRAVELVLGHIPPGTQALYIASTPDALAEAIRAKGRGPYDFTPAAFEYHLVLWDRRPVWVSSADCTLEVVTP